jgi:hypothetical protein
MVQLGPSEPDQGPLAACYGGPGWELAVEAGPGRGWADENAMPAY